MIAKTHRIFAIFLLLQMLSASYILSQGTNPIKPELTCSRCHSEFEYINGKKLPYRSIRCKHVLCANCFDIAKKPPYSDFCPLEPENERDRTYGFPFSVPLFDPYTINYLATNREVLSSLKKVKCSKCNVMRDKLCFCKVCDRDRIGFINNIETDALTFKYVTTDMFLTLRVYYIDMLKRLRCDNHYCEHVKKDRNNAIGFDYFLDNFNYYLRTVSMHKYMERKIECLSTRINCIASNISRTDIWTERMESSDENERKKTAREFINKYSHIGIAIDFIQKKFKKMNDFAGQLIKCIDHSVPPKPDITEVEFSKIRKKEDAEMEKIREINPKRRKINYTTPNDSISFRPEEKPLFYELCDKIQTVVNTPNDEFHDTSIYEMNTANWKYYKIISSKLGIVSTNSSIVSKGNTVFFVGGMNKNGDLMKKLEMFDIKDKNAISTTLSLQVPRYKCTSIIYEGSLIVVGGCYDIQVKKKMAYNLNAVTYVQDFKLEKERDFTASTEIYDFSRPFSFWRTLNFPRADCALVIYKGCLFAIGGYNQNGFVLEVEVYLKEHDDWFLYTMLSRPRAGHAATVFKNQIYISGGYSDHSGELLNTVERWYPSPNMRGEWYHEVPMLTARRGHKLVTIKKKNGEDYCILAVGGYDRDESPIFQNEMCTYESRPYKWVNIEK